MQRRQADHQRLTTESEDALDIVDHFGVRIPINPEIISDKIAERIRGGLYEHKEAQQIKRIVQPGERILEIGGGIGFISTLCSKNPNTEAIRVFEANPQLLPFINEVHALNTVSNAEAVNAVLINGTRPAALDFYVRQHFWASSLSPEPNGYVKSFSVPTRSFAQEVEEFRPSLIICDIEGGELDLFMNANLTGVARVYLEVHQKVIGRRGMKALFDAFSARNFHYDQRYSQGSVVMFSHIG
jgi:FkbM family methyltransferase